MCRKEENISSNTSVAKEKVQGKKSTKKGDLWFSRRKEKGGNEFFVWFRTWKLKKANNASEGESSSGGKGLSEKEKEGGEGVSRIIRRGTF